MENILFTSADWVECPSIFGSRTNQRLMTPLLWFGCDVCVKNSRSLRVQTAAGVYSGERAGPTPLDVSDIIHSFGAQPHTKADWSQFNYATRPQSRPVFRCSKMYTYIQQHLSILYLCVCVCVCVFVRVSETKLGKSQRKKFNRGKRSYKSNLVCACDH